jgi:hypothetical protein
VFGSDRFHCIKNCVSFSSFYLESIFYKDILHLDLKIYLKFHSYRMPFCSGFSVDRFHCTCAFIQLKCTCFYPLFYMHSCNRFHCIKNCVSFSSFYLESIFYILLFREYFFHPFIQREFFSSFYLESIFYILLFREYLFHPFI